jgi:hypothetical protein
MKRPTWATVVGVLGIIFGLLGLIGAAQTIIMPKMIQTQKELFSGMEKTMQTATPEQRAATEGMKKMVDSMLGQIPPWFEAWFVFIGILALLVNAIYVFAAIALLLVKKIAIDLFLFSTSFSIVLGVGKMIASANIFSQMGFGMIFSGSIGIIIDIILLIVVAMGDKTAFYEEQ